MTIWEVNVLPIAYSQLQDVVSILGTISCYLNNAKPSQEAECKSFMNRAFPVSPLL